MQAPLPICAVEDFPGSQGESIHLTLQDAMRFTNLREGDLPDGATDLCEASEMLGEVFNGGLGQYLGNAGRLQRFHPDLKDRLHRAFEKMGEPVGAEIVRALSLHIKDAPVATMRAAQHLNFVDESGASHETPVLRELADLLCRLFSWERFDAGLRRAIGKTDGLILVRKEAFPEAFARFALAHPPPEEGLPRGLPLRPWLGALASATLLRDVGPVTRVLGPPAKLGPYRAHTGIRLPLVAGKVAGMLTLAIDPPQALDGRSSPVGPVRLDLDFLPFDAGPVVARRGMEISQAELEQAEARGQRRLPVTHRREGEAPAKAAATPPAPKAAASDPMEARGTVSLYAELLLRIAVIGGLGWGLGEVLAHAERLLGADAAPYAIGFYVALLLSALWANLPKINRARRIIQRRFDGR